MLSCEHGGMTTRFGARGSSTGQTPVVVGMRACSLPSCEHGADSTVARCGGRHRGGHPSDGCVRACSHAVVRTRRHDKHSLRRRSWGPSRRQTGVRACSYALVRTQRCDSTFGIRRDSGWGSLWLRRGEGEGTLCAGPGARFSALVRLKGARFSGSKTDFFDAAV